MYNKFNPINVQIPTKIDSPSPDIDINKLTNKIPTSTMKY
jgi:hypothetical protein